MGTYNTRLHMIFSALSALGNVCTVGDIGTTSPNETISARAHRLALPHEWWINLLFFWERDHCRKAYMSDVVYASELTRTHADHKHTIG
jgi:hypothetical protein